MWSTSPIANKVKITQYSARITQEGHHTMSEKINEQIECCDCNEIHEDLLKIVNDTMPEETELYDLAELFKVFGDSTRTESSLCCLKRRYASATLQRC